MQTASTPSQPQRRPRLRAVWRWTALALTLAFFIIFAAGTLWVRARRVARLEQELALAFPEELEAALGRWSQPSLVAQAREYVRLQPVDLMYNRAALQEGLSGLGRFFGPNLLAQCRVSLPVQLSPLPASDATAYAGDGDAAAYCAMVEERLALGLQRGSVEAQAGEVGQGAVLATVGWAGEHPVFQYDRGSFDVLVDELAVAISQCRVEAYNTSGGRAALKDLFFPDPTEAIGLQIDLTKRTDGYQAFCQTAAEALQARDFQVDGQALTAQELADVLYPWCLAAQVGDLTAHPQGMQMSLSLLHSRETILRESAALLEEAARQPMTQTPSRAEWKARLLARVYAQAYGLRSQPAYVEGYAVSAQDLPQLAACPELLEEMEGYLRALEEGVDELVVGASRLPLLEAQELPPSGVLAGQAGGGASLTLTAGEQALYLELEPVTETGGPNPPQPEADAGEGCVAVLVRPGEAYTLDVRPGAYRAKAALGDAWLGEQQLFGPTGRYVMLPEPVTLGAGEASTLDLAAAVAIARDGF